MIFAATKTMWYFARASGAVSLLLLAVSFGLGIITLLGWAHREAPRMVIQGLHRNLSLMVVVFLGLHIATSVFDSFVTIRWIDALVPFIGSYRPIWLGLGAMAFDMMLAVIITSLLRVRVGYRAWRAVHWFSYVMFPVAVVHALGTGSDASLAWLQIVLVLSAAIVVVLTGWRLAARMPAHAKVRAASMATLAVTPVLIALWAVNGPTQPGWASSGSSGEMVTPLVDGFDAGFTGTYTEVNDEGDNATMHIVAALGIDPSSRLDIVITGPRVNGNVAVRTATVTLGPVDDPTLWTGPMSSLSGGKLNASLSDEFGESIDVAIDLGFNSTAHSVNGHVAATPTPAGTPAPATTAKTATTTKTTAVKP